MLKLKVTTLAPVLLLSLVSMLPLQAARAEPPQLVKSLCQSCHGVDGIGVMPGAANLSGQQYEYLREQMRAYRSGRRQSPHMSVVSKSLTDEDVDLVSQWYSSIRITVEPPQ